MFDRLTRTAEMMSSSVRAFGMFPSLIVPLLFVWIAITALAAAFLTDLSWLDSSYVGLGAIAFGCFAVAGVLLSFASFILLERVRQIEMDEVPSVAGAIGDALSNTIRALPLLLVWSLLWLVLNVLTFVLRGDDSDDEPVQAGDSLWDLSLRGLCDATRMLVFLALPALAWEAHAGPLYAIRRAATVAKTYKLEFAAGFVLSELAALLAVWPPTVVLLYDAESDLGAPGLAWVVAVALAGLGWSFVMLVQQLFAAELYAWFLVWEDACERARAEGTVAPAPTDIRRPMVVDGVPDLVAVGT